MAGEIHFSFSHDNLSEARHISSVKQLTEASTRLSEKIASMGYGNLLTEQVRLTYLQSGLPIPDDLLEELSEETTVDILNAISRTQREADIRASINGTRARSYHGIIASSFSR